MKKTICLLIIVLSLAQCKTQQQDFAADSVKNDIYRAFLKQMKPYSYLDKNFSNKNLIESFNSKYNLNKQMFKTSDSMCKNSTDLSQRKFYCSLADSFQVYDTLLSRKELGLLTIKYNKDSEKNLLDVDALIQDIPFRMHSEKFYEKINYGVYGGIPNLKEFPSIRIENLYFSSNKNIAIIAFSSVVSPTQVDTNFYILEKKNGIWRKPIGAFKI